MQFSHLKSFKIRKVNDKIRKVNDKIRTSECVDSCAKQFRVNRSFSLVLYIVNKHYNKDNSCQNLVDN